VENNGQVLIHNASNGVAWTPKSVLQRYLPLGNSGLAFSVLGGRAVALYDCRVFHAHQIFRSRHSVGVRCRQSLSIPGGTELIRRIMRVNADVLLESCVAKRAGRMIDVRSV
jgi:hypothetical protein